jgi:cytochrome c peroxidase
MDDVRLEVMKASAQAIAQIQNDIAMLKEKKEIYMELVSKGPEDNISDDQYKTLAALRAVELTKVDMKYGHTESLRGIVKAMQETLETKQAEI